MKRTLEKRLLVHNAAIREIIKRNGIKITWIKKELGDNLAKSGAPSKILWDVLRSSKIIEL